MSSMITAGPSLKLVQRVAPGQSALSGRRQTVTHSLRVSLSWHRRPGAQPREGFVLLQSSPCLPSPSSPVHSVAMIHSPWMKWQAMSDAQTGVEERGSQPVLQTPIPSMLKRSNMQRESKVSAGQSVSVIQMFLQVWGSSMKPAQSVSGSQSSKDTQPSPWVPVPTSEHCTPPPLRR